MKRPPSAFDVPFRVSPDLVRAGHHRGSWKARAELLRVQEVHLATRENRHVESGIGVDDLQAVPEEVARPLEFVRGLLVQRGHHAHPQHDQVGVGSEEAPRSLRPR